MSEHTTSGPTDPPGPPRGLVPAPARTGELVHVPAPDATTSEDGELRPFEVAFRAGLLLGAGIFFYESVGSPWEKNFFGLAALLLSALIVSTLVFQWRVLADWRRKTHQVLYAGLVVVLTIPVAAALSPSLGQSTLPSGVEQLLIEISAQFRAVPGLAILLGLVKGFLSFLFLCLTLIILLLGSPQGRKGGLIVAGGLLAVILLLFYPTVETALGFVFLGLFLSNQWETPLLIPDKLRPHLRPAQIDYLRELVTQGSLSTGETRVYLENQPAYFGELLEYKLVQYDPVARDVLPAHRLVHDPTGQFVEKAMAAFRRTLWIMVGVAYVILPDPIPGPIDDIIVLLLCTGGGTRLFEMFRGPAMARRMRRM